MLKLDHVCNLYFCTNIDWRNRHNFSTFIGCMGSSFWCLIWSHRCRQPILTYCFLSKIWWRILVVIYPFSKSAEPPVQDPAELLSGLFEAVPPLQTARQGKVNKIFSVSDDSSPTKKTDEILRLWNCCQHYEQWTGSTSCLSPNLLCLGLNIGDRMTHLIHPQSKPRLNRNNHLQKSRTTITTLFSRCTALGVSSLLLPFLPPGPSCCTSSAMLSLMRCCFFDNKIMLLINTTPFLTTYW